MKMINCRMKEQQKFLLFFCLSFLFLLLYNISLLSLHLNERKLLFTSLFFSCSSFSISWPSHTFATFCSEFLLLFGIRFYCIFTFMTHLFFLCFLMTMMMVVNPRTWETVKKKKFRHAFHGRWCSENGKWTWDGEEET